MTAGAQDIGGLLQDIEEGELAGVWITVLALTRSGKIGKILRKLSFQDLEQVTGCEGDKSFQAWLRVSVWAAWGLGMLFTFVLSDSIV